MKLFIIISIFIISCLSYANTPIFNNEFNRYLDGPTLGADNIVYFANGSQIYGIKNKKELFLLIDFSKKQRLITMLVLQELLKTKMVVCY